MIEMTWYDTKMPDEQEFFDKIHHLGATIFLETDEYFRQKEMEKNNMKAFPFIRIKDTENTDPYSDTYNGVYMEYPDFKAWIEEIISYAE